VRLLNHCLLAVGDLNDTTVAGTYEDVAIGRVDVHGADVGTDGEGVSFVVVAVEGLNLLASTDYDETGSGSDGTDGIVTALDGFDAFSILPDIHMSSC